MKKLIACVALATLSALVWALPTLQQVEAQVRQGNYTQAESMMREVVAARPDSARAHYIYAEILAHDGKLAQAVDEARAARTIDPDVKFTDPEKFRTFEAALLRAQNPAARTSPAPSPFESRGQAPAAPGAPGAPGPPYGAGYPAQRPGSGMLGVGLGAAGGLAAGMLAERMLNS